MIPGQKVFPILPHPIPGIIIYLFNEGVEIQLVIVRCTCNLQHSHGYRIVQFVCKGFANKFMNQQISTGCFYIDKPPGSYGVIILVHFFHQAMAKVGTNQQAIQANVAYQQS